MNIKRTILNTALGYWLQRHTLASMQSDLKTSRDAMSSAVDTVEPKKPWTMAGDALNSAVTQWKDTWRTQVNADRIYMWKTLKNARTEKDTDC